jgi:muramidase (phage lysozyme)
MISYKDIKKTGDPISEYFKKLAFVESGKNPNANNKHTDAAGLFQFIPSTWNYYVKKMGLDYDLDDRYDPEKAMVVARKFTEDNIIQLQEGQRGTSTLQNQG